jgi:hypothetical protein
MPLANGLILYLTTPHLASFTIKNHPYEHNRTLRDTTWIALCSRVEVNPHYPRKSGGVVACIKPILDQFKKYSFYVPLPGTTSSYNALPKFGHTTDTLPKYP